MCTALSTAVYSSVYNCLRPCVQLCTALCTAQHRCLPHTIVGRVMFCLQRPLAADTRTSSDCSLLFGDEIFAYLSPVYTIIKMSVVAETNAMGLVVCAIVWYTPTNSLDISWMDQSLPISVRSERFRRWWLEEPKPRKIIVTWATSEVFINTVLKIHTSEDMYLI